MKQKKQYQAPLILRKIAFRIEGAILAGSIVDKATVTSQGQQVDTYDFSGSTFNHEWED
ncbi:MAG: hypothetical protein IJU08_04810 [Bacteroidales bacterium]|nr:hypothetical protein [Bacteroidales bacterium]